MLDTVFGLPSHVLIVHAVVVGVPLAAMATLGIAVRPAWRRTLGWWVVALDVLVVIATYLARQSGMWFFRRLGEPEMALHHVELGQSLLWFVLALPVAAAATTLADRLRQGWAVHAVAALTVLVALTSVVQTVRTGHAGTSAVWRAVVESTNPARG